MTEIARAALQRATSLLKNAGISGAQRDARLLLAYSLGVDLAALSARLNEQLANSALHKFDQSIAMRAQNKPVSHITGRRSFWAHDFMVNGDVLDPRPDTESLVALALEKPFTRILDLGTGSGAIALSLLAEVPKARALATDISAAALGVARHNAKRLGLSDRIEFTKTDWFDGVKGRFDLVISNPPYISATEMESLAPDISNWEPHLALTPGGDGLLAYRCIAKKLREYLTENGRAIFEIGCNQAADVSGIFSDSGFDNVSVYKDLSGHDRIVAIIV